jgi:hypothetical protein
MKLFIPACGDRIILTQSWEFDLYLEHRNMKFAKEMKLVGPNVNNWGVFDEDHDLKSVRATVPKGTVLECDRVYIRTFSKSALQTGNDFDSISWKCIQDNGKPVKNKRFWAKLPDCYNIEYKLEPDSLYRDRVKAVKIVLES